MTLKRKFKKYVAQDRDRFGNVRFYVRRNGKKLRLPDNPASEEFDAAYNKAMEVFERGEIVPIKRGDPALKASKPIGVVYFLKCGQFFKIGYSTNAVNRLHSLQTGLPEPMDFMVCVPGSRQLERELHLKFQKNRTHREWFKVGPNFFREIGKIITDQRYKTGSNESHLGVAS